MTSIFILQLICCIITGMLGLHIAMASLQVRWKVRRYETSRWLLCGSMAVFCIHYFLQMTQGFRAQGADVGAVVNIMFYTPAVFAITLSIINMESTRSVMRRYCLRSAAAYAQIVSIFIFGVFSNKSLHLGGYTWCSHSLWEVWHTSSMPAILRYWSARKTVGGVGWRSSATRSICTIQSCIGMRLSSLSSHSHSLQYLVVGGRSADVTCSHILCS